MICTHLHPLEKELTEKGIPELYRGQPWTENCREWVYYDCFLDAGKLISRLHLPACVEPYSNDDPKSGLEEGLVCNQCFDAIIGHHHSLKNKKNAETIE